MEIKKTVPIRGIKQDYYGDKEKEILEENKQYAMKSIRNSLIGSPDFEPFKSFLVKPAQQNVTNAKKTTETPKNE
jgi:hypothetical protein